MDEPTDPAKLKSIDPLFLRWLPEPYNLIAEWTTYLPLEDVLLLPDRPTYHGFGSVPLSQGLTDGEDYVFGPDAPHPIAGLRVPRSLVHRTLHHCWIKHDDFDLSTRLSDEVHAHVFVTEDLSRPLRMSDLLEGFQAFENLRTKFS